MKTITFPLDVEESYRLHVKGAPIERAELIGPGNVLLGVLKFTGVSQTSLDFFGEVPIHGALTNGMVCKLYAVDQFDDENIPSLMFEVDHISTTWDSLNTNSYTINVTAHNESGPIIANLHYCPDKIGFLT